MQTEPVTTSPRIPELQLPRDSRANAVQRKDPMVRIKVRARTSNQLIPGGYLLPLGESICLVYEPDLPAIEAMVEKDSDALKQAEVYFTKSIEASVRDELMTLSDEEARSVRLLQARQEFCGSVEAKFKDLHQREILPLESLEVLERGIPAPVQQQQVEQQSFLASTIAKEVATALAQALPTVLAAVVKEMGAQSKQQK